MSFGGCFFFFFFFFFFWKEQKKNRTNQNNKQHFRYYFQDLNQIIKNYLFSLKIFSINKLFRFHVHSERIT